MMHHDTPLYHLSPEDPEWATAWGAFPDPEMYNDERGEALQYMGTVPATDSAGGYIHEFRHRAIPGTQQRRYWGIRSSVDWCPREVAMQAHLTRLGASHGA